MIMMRGTPGNDLHVWPSSVQRFPGATDTTQRVTQSKEKGQRQISPVGWPHACSHHSLVLHCIFSSCDNRMTRWIPLFLSFLCATAQQDPTAAPTTQGWGGCINPDDPTASTLVRIGQPTAICLTIGQGGDWAAGVPYLRFIFTPKADVYSRFDIPNCK
jgi:hypothetical protein